MNHQNPERSEIEKRNRKHHEIPKPKIEVGERESTLGTRWFNGSSTDFECLTVNGSSTEFQWLSVNGSSTFGTVSLRERSVWEWVDFEIFTVRGRVWESGVWDSGVWDWEILNGSETVDCFKWEGKKTLKRNQVYKTRFWKSSFINSLSKWKLSPC